jgi:hypothetical protein
LAITEDGRVPLARAPTTLSGLRVAGPRAEPVQVSTALLKFARE